MPDEPTEQEVNPNPESEVDLTEDQLDGLLEKTREGESEGSLDLDQDLEVEGEEASDDSDEDVDEDEDEKKDDEDEDEAEEDGEEEDGEKDDEDDDEDSSLPPGVRVQIRKVLGRLEILEAEKDQISTELERERLLRDQNAGRLGSLMQQLKASQDRQASGEPDETDTDDDAQRQSKVPTSGDQALEEIRTEKVERAINGSANEFYSENQAFFEALEKEVGEDANKQFQVDLVAKVRDHQKSLGEDLFTMNPKTAGKLSKSLIKSAFADMKLELIRDFQKKAVEQSEDSRRKIRARKKGAAGVRSNKRPAASNTKNKSVVEASDAELDAAIKVLDFD